MRWKSNRRNKRLRRCRQKNKAAHQEGVQRRARLMQRNEFILLTKYREIIRHELNERQSLREKCSNLRQSTIQNESKKRCELFRENNNANILMLSDYLDKVEGDLKSMLHRWESNYGYDIETNIENFKSYLLIRFQTYVSELDLSEFNLKEQDIDLHCKIDEEIANIERKTSVTNIIEIEELKRKLKMLTDELEEEEIRELACVKIREREISKLTTEIELLRQQSEVLASKEDFALLDILK